MKDNVISFTKIDITQLKIGNEIKHELPTEDFLQRLKIAIENDVTKHHISYDKDKGTYTIFHNGMKYKVYYGDGLVDAKCDQIDLIQELNGLVELSNKQKQYQEFKTPVAEVKTKSLEEIIQDGNDGIFDTEDDKVKYVKYLKEKIAKSSIFAGIGKIFKKSYRYEMDENIGQTIAGVFIGAFLITGFLALTKMVSDLWAIGAGIAALDTVSGLVLGISIANISTKLVFRTVKAIVTTIVNGIAKSKMKRKVGIIEKSIVESELSESMSAKAPVKQNKTNNKIVDKPLKGEVRETIKKIFAKFDYIKDKELKMEYATRLDEIIEMCKELPDTDYNVKYSKLVHMLSFLDGEVSEIVRKEIANNAMNMEFQKTRDVVDSISSAQSHKGK